MAVFSQKAANARWSSTRPRLALKDSLHNSLRPVINRTRAVCCVVFLANSGAIGRKKTPCSPSRSGCHRLARVMQRVLNSLA